MATHSRQAGSESTAQPTREDIQTRPDAADGRGLADTKLPKEAAGALNDGDYRSEVPGDNNAVADVSQEASASSSQTDEARTEGAHGRSFAEPATKNSNRKADQFFALSERLPIQIFNEETWVQKMGHWGPLVTGLASIGLALYVWANTAKLTKLQIEIQQKQVELQQQQLLDQSADTRFKLLTDLASPDPNTRMAAEIALARHGMQAFPVVRYALGLDREEVRKGAVNVFDRLFQAETNAGRDELLLQLMYAFRSPNKTLQTGIVQSFVKIESLLNANQHGKVIAFLQQNVAPEPTCSEQGGRQVVFEAAMFAGANRNNGIPYLLAVANVPRCGDAWLQSMYNLRSFAADMPPQERSDLRQKIEQIKNNALGQLDPLIIEQDLTHGADFAGFLSEGEVDVTFEAFKKRVQKEFDTLIAQLG